MNPRITWAGLYVAANAVALIYSASTGELLGDGAGFSMLRPGTLYVAFFLISTSIVALFATFRFLCLVPSNVSRAPTESPVLDLAFCALILFFFSYVHTTGLFVAGSAERGGTLLSAFFVMFNVDLLFLIYYAACRHHAGFKFVTAVWVLSVLQRGWFGYIFLIIALELVRMIRQGQVKVWLVAALLLLIPVFPVLDAVKVFVRLNPGMQISDILFALPGLASDVDIDLLAAVPVLLEKIIGRLQVLTHAYLIIDNQDFFVSEVNAGNVVSFWREGLFGVLYDRLFAIERLPESSQLVASFIAPATQSAWNVNPSLVGWFFIYGDALPFALVYVLLLCVASFGLMQKISNTCHARDALWVYWLILLVPGWISQFVSLVGAMLMSLAGMTAVKYFVELMARQQSRQTALCQAKS